ncbi:MAG: hypothetical protein KDA65_11615, partial [Planctomycetaceae bacterium]|nr:hypothetical protein [Planctomycetaceae bacterium]
MGVEARVKFFTIDRCGYYKYRSSHSAFGEIGGVLSNLSDWVSGKSVSLTATYHPTNEQDENLLNTYCFSIRSNSSGDFLLTTWNETESDEGTVASLELTGRVENAAIELIDVPDGYVPGYPAYFWFPNGLNGFATIQFRSRLNGRNNLTHYLEPVSKPLKYSEQTSELHEAVIQMRV